MAEWRHVLGWEGFYEVSDDGRVKALAREFTVVRQGRPLIYRRAERILQPVLCNGYYRLTFQAGERNEKPYLHHLVCTAFHGQRPSDQHEVAHGDGTRLNNRPENLRWATRLENVRDKVIHGTQPRGEKIWIAKLTEDQVREILRSTSGNRELALRFGVDPSAISEIKTGRNWKHIFAEELAA